MSFEQWKAKVELAVKELLAVGTDDLPDCPYADWYQRRVSPKTVAKRVKKFAENY